MWGKIWAFVRRAWAAIAAAIAGLLLVAKLVSDWVGRSTFWDDFTLLLERGRPVTDFFARQPEWLFYPALLAVFLTGAVVAYARVIAEIALVPRAGAERAPTAGETRRLFVSHNGHLMPDISLHDATNYIARMSTWEGDEDALIHEVRDKLSLGRLPAWAAASPSSAVEEVAAWGWRDAVFDFENSTATTSDGRRLFRVQFDRDLVTGVWPARRRPY